MRIARKIELINKLTEELQARYDYLDIEHFLKSFNIELYYNDNLSSDIKSVLYKAKDNILKEIAEELGIATEHIIITPPKNWEKSKLVKAFLSHTSSFKNEAKKLRDALKTYNIDCFVAHEDIIPSQEWQNEIDKALQVMDFFISFHTEGFKESFWCQQEVGYAVSRNVKVIPIKFDGIQDPCGFIGRFQALTRTGKNAHMVAKEITDLLKTDKKTKSLYEEIINPNNIIDEELPF